MSACPSDLVKDQTACLRSVESPARSVAARRGDADPNPRACTNDMGKGQRSHAYAIKFARGERLCVRFEMGRCRIQRCATPSIRETMACTQPTALDVDLHAVATNLTQGHLEVGIRSTRAQPKIDTRGARQNHRFGKHLRAIGNSRVYGERRPVIIRLDPPGCRLPLSGNCLGRTQARIGPITINPSAGTRWSSALEATSFPKI